MFFYTMRSFLFLFVVICISSTSLVSSEKGTKNDEVHEFYFAYGSNLSYSFLKERLKNGSWIDDWNKDGFLEGEAPVDLGCYELKDYEFGYTLNVEPFGEEGVAANIQPKKNAIVYGALYKIAPQHLLELDKSEDVPVAYERIQVTVRKVNTIKEKYLHCPKEIDAWVYVGNDRLYTENVDPDPQYLYHVIRAAHERGLPETYIKEYVEKPLYIAK